jgi:hypothetical protein
MNAHAYELASQPLQYPVADLALNADGTVVQPTEPGNPDAAASTGMDGGKRAKKLTNIKVEFRGKMYVVRNGPKGGHYILVAGKKHYVKV